MSGLNLASVLAHHADRFPDRGHRLASAQSGELDLTDFDVPENLTLVCGAVHGEDESGPSPEDKGNGGGDDRDADRSWHGITRGGRVGECTGGRCYPHQHAWARRRADTIAA